MINKLKPKSEFSRNVLTLMTGTTIAQAIPIAISPILTRIYTPEDFGVFALFLAIATIFGSIANARYELAIMLPKKDEDAINIFALGFIITCFISLILLVLVLLFNDYFTTLLGNEEIGFWLYFIPISVFFIGLFNVLNYFNNRKKNYKDLRNVTILRSIVLSIVQLSLGFIKQGATGLITGEIISRMVSNTRLLKKILKDKLLVSKISKIKMLSLAKRYNDFPKYNLPSTLSDTITQQLPFLIIPNMFSLSISGYFSLSQKLIALPSSLIAKSISQVYFQKISENINDKIENMPILIKTMKKLILLALPISILIFLFAPQLFIIIFGEAWEISGKIAKYLSLIFFITFVVSALSITLVAYENLKILAIWQYIYLISSLIFYGIIFNFNFTLENFLFYFVIHEYIIYSIYLYLVIRTVYKKDNNIKKVY
jgi:O-antigen/teichoic acid export membrane protein